MATTLRPSRAQRAPPAEAGDWIAVCFVGLALALGGGGSPSPLPEMLVEWLALAALTAAAALSWRPLGPWPWLVCGLLVLLPMLQLLPLPPALWQALPGRSNELTALRLVGSEQTWMPLSVDPPRTLAALLALLAPVAGLLLAARASARGRWLLLVTIVAMAVATALLGAAQLAGGSDGPLRFYAHSHRDSLTGFQANRNATADVLLVGLAALGALWVQDDGLVRQRWAIPAAGVAALLAGAVVLTGSRTGIALLALLGLTAGAMWGSRRRSASGFHGWVVTAAVVLAGAGAWAVAAIPVLRAIATRFVEGGDARGSLWADTVYAAGQVWPWGSGIGTFVPVFVAAEALEAVDRSYPNRAHNDFLEFALEAGAPGVILLVALAALLVWRGVMRLRLARSGRERAEIGFSGAALAILAAHSVVDYPLRSMALAVVAGVAAGLILTRAGGSARIDRPGQQ